MPTEVIAALISLVGAAIGTLGGILATNRLTLYRIEQLEKKQDKHNHFIERTYELEKKTKEYDEKFKTANHRIADLEEWQTKRQK